MAVDIVTLLPADPAWIARITETFHAATSAKSDRHRKVATIPYCIGRARSSGREQEWHGTCTCRGHSSGGALASSSGAERTGLQLRRTCDLSVQVSQGSQARLRCDGKPSINPR